MANSFDFELRADDQVSAALEKINEQVKGLQPELDKTNDGLALGGEETKDNLSDLNRLFSQIGRYAKDNVQFIGDMVPPLRNFTGMAGKFGGMIGKFGLAGGAAHLAGKGISAMGGQISEAADNAYSLQVAAENAGMGVKDFTQLAGAMHLLGSDSASARESVEGLYKTFNDALQGRNSSVLAVMNQIHAGIVRNADGTANVLGTMQQLAAVFPKLAPQNQKTVADALGLDANGLQLLREGARLKELLTQSEEVGLTVDPKINSELVSLNRSLAGVSASWDGLKNRVGQKISGFLLSDGSVTNGIEGINDLMTNGDYIGLSHALDFVSTDDAKKLRRIEGDKKLYDSLPRFERGAVDAGFMTDAVRKKYNSWYGPSDAAGQLQQDMNSVMHPQPGSGDVTPGIGDISPSGVTDPTALSVRNNNPWNINYAGQRDATPAGRFAHFQSGDEGIAAADRQLRLYYSGASKNVDHPLRTLAEIISKASPASDGNNTPLMIARASNQLGISPDAPLSLNDPRERARVLGALFNQEGNNPYSTERILQVIQGLPTSLTPSAVTTIPQPESPATPSIVTPYHSPGLPAAGQREVPGAKDIANALSEVLKQSGMKVEITMVDRRTGQRQTYTGNSNGAKVTMALPFPG